MFCHRLALSDIRIRLICIGSVQIRAKNCETRNSTFGLPASIRKWVYLICKLLIPAPLLFNQGVASYKFLRQHFRKGMLL